LLDAVKDKKTRDAVRSVLERLTGGSVKPPAPEAAEPALDAPAAAPATAPADADGEAKPN
jgi:AsmA protein